MSKQIQQHLIYFKYQQYTVKPVFRDNLRENKTIGSWFNLYEMYYSGI